MAENSEDAAEILKFQLYETNKERDEERDRYTDEETETERQTQFVCYRWLIEWGGAVSYISCVDAPLLFLQSSICRSADLRELSFKVFNL